MWARQLRQVSIRAYAPRMGFIQSGKDSRTPDAAREAWESGLGWFTATLDWPSVKSGFTGTPTEWPVQIDSIESVGWALHTFSAVTDRRGNPQAVVLFKRT